MNSAEQEKCASAVRKPTFAVPTLKRPSSTLLMHGVVKKPSHHVTSDVSDTEALTDTSWLPAGGRQSASPAPAATSGLKLPASFRSRLKAPGSVKVNPAHAPSGARGASSQLSKPASKLQLIKSSAVSRQRKAVHSESMSNTIGLDC